MKDRSKSRCESSSHQFMKEKAKNHVDDLQGIFTNLQSAVKESRIGDIVILEEQMHQMLREWKSELNEPSPACSLTDGSLGSLGEELAQMLQKIEEEDDATSVLAKPAPLETEPHLHNLNESSAMYFQEKYFDDKQPEDLAFHQFGDHASSLYTNAVNNSDIVTQSDHHPFSLKRQFDHNIVVHNSDSLDQFDAYPHYKQNMLKKNSELKKFNLLEDLDSPFGTTKDAKHSGNDAIPCILPNIHPPPCAFLGPKCALWDCSRPAQGSEWCQDYCSSCHAELASNEGLPGIPILRPGGIAVKDGSLYAALNAKTQGKEVGIPECEGAASTKSPWNAAELFDLVLLEGETVREWLFFDKPRRAFESGNRKQRSLPDYTGRGWHESRKQVMKEHGGQKRSYYMDPQPLGYLEWHLYEYEINNQNGCALYRLELKLVDKKKSPKGKVSKESLSDLQNKMGRLTADVLIDDKNPVRGKTRA